MIIQNLKKYQFNIWNIYFWNLFICKKIKEAFQKFAGENPDLFDWKKYNIPLLNEEIANVKAEQKQKKKQQKKKNEKERKKIQKEEERKEKVATEKKEFAEKKSQLSDREKRLLAAENRYFGKTCEFCKKELNGVPFTRLDFSYCSSISRTHFIS